MTYIQNIKVLDGMEKYPNFPIESKLHTTYINKDLDLFQKQLTIQYKELNIWH